MFSRQCNAFTEDGNGFLWKREPDTIGAHAKSAMVYSSRGYSVIIGGVDGYDSTVVETIHMREEYSDPQVVYNISKGNLYYQEWCLGPRKSSSSSD